LTVWVPAVDRAPEVVPAWVPIVARVWLPAKVARQMIGREPVLVTVDWVVPVCLIVRVVPRIGRSSSQDSSGLAGSAPREEEAHFSPAERARRLRGGLLAIASVSLPFWASVAWLLH